MGVPEIGPYPRKIVFFIFFFLHFVIKLTDVTIYSCLGGLADVDQDYKENETTTGGKLYGGHSNGQATEQEKKEDWTMAITTEPNII